MSLSAARIEAAFRAACQAEIDTLKPGNVHRFAAGHGMSAVTFAIAAKAAAPAIARTGASVGARIIAATEASVAAVGMNANLGIVLLAAPLAAAAERVGAGATPADPVAALRSETIAVLSSLDAEDTRLAYRAIALANPGGLGRRSDNDVRDAPRIGLVAAMTLASDRDLVARQYANGFGEIFNVGMAAIHAQADPGNEILGDRAALASFLAFATRFPDSHIDRKFGASVSDEICSLFKHFDRNLTELVEPDARLALALAFDSELKAKGVNPGTSADLTVGTLFVKELAEALAG
ncbi:triphosphoribosyl-dephospho-CoA synthase [Jiella sp. MQZ9-1]|uniref:Triphosphoribosyl-dephospho-CoA synthase n=1 Tax=Jiella flava TaxID=2816857 RepID=A0A939G0L5_9HYPH|nr:triphosphoribosyl-dephospho-CoA synthase [Jiella flava]MBO0663388.1 triphosphoribosyl-dephospho-CoA synthase [Jiella flava]MCD2471964.1 triphosphoribosyl-dephospho-CoA synthase [Jiella flava]